VEKEGDFPREEIKNWNGDFQITEKNSVLLQR
jgi:hypothetical protein